MKIWTSENFPLYGSLSTLWTLYYCCWNLQCCCAVINIKPVFITAHLSSDILDTACSVTEWASHGHTHNVTVSEADTHNTNVSEPHSCSVTVSEPHKGIASVSEPHTRNIYMSEPPTRRVTVSEPHSGKSHTHNAHSRRVLANVWSSELCMGGDHRIIILGNDAWQFKLPHNTHPYIDKDRVQLFYSCVRIALYIFQDVFSCNPGPV